MELTFNDSNREIRIKEEFKNAMKMVNVNLKQGIRNTDLYIPKDIAGLVRSKINEELKKQKKEDNFTWCNVRQGINPHTGKVEYFTGEVVGDDRHYKLRYIGC